MASHDAQVDDVSEKRKKRRFSSEISNGRKSPRCAPSSGQILEHLESEIPERSSYRARYL